MNDNFSQERASQNKTALLSFAATNMVLVLCYASEVVKGSRTILYYAVFSALALIPTILCIVTYKRKKDSGRLGAMMAIGFLPFYIFTIFTTVSPVAYVYGIMIAMGLIVYGSFKISNYFMTALFLINVAQVVYLVVTGGIGQVNMADLEIRIASLLLFLIFSVRTTITIRTNNASKMEAIEAEKNRVSEMADKILSVTDKMCMDIASIQEKKDIMEELADKNLSAMEEVTNGNNDTVNSVQMQLIKTNDIKEAIDQVTDASGLILSHTEDTRAQLVASKENIDALIHHVNISYQANENVSKELAELTGYTARMENIISLIDGITSQTSLLSLNASIEAARAGEAGRGFAVVASEISNLANQTQDATVNITDLIKNISDKLNKVVEVISSMIDNANEQNEAASNTAESFDKIAVKTDAVYEKAEEMAQLVKGLISANEEIVKGIETISAVAEEVTANSNMTYESSLENKKVTGEIGDLVEALDASAKELNALEQ